MSSQLAKELMENLLEEEEKSRESSMPRTTLRDLGRRSGMSNYGTRDGGGWEVQGQEDLHVSVSRGEGVCEVGSKPHYPEVMCGHEESAAVCGVRRQCQEGKIAQEVGGEEGTAVEGLKEQQQAPKLPKAAGGPRRPSRWRRGSFVRWQA